jgi:hypothetical protein
MSVMPNQTLCAWASLNPGSTTRSCASTRPRARDLVPGGDDPSVEDGRGVHDGRLGVTGVDPPVLDDQIDHHLP